MKARRWVAAGRLLVGVALLVWLTRAGVVPWRALAGLLDAWNLALLAFGIFVLDMWVTAWRLSVLIEGQGLALPVAASFRLGLIGNVFNLFLPSGGGDAARLYYAIADTPGQRTEIATVLVLDRLIGLVAILVIPVLLSPFLLDLLAASSVLRVLVVLAAAGALACTVILTLLVANRSRIVQPMIGLGRRLVSSRHLPRVLDALHRYRTRPALLAKAMALSLVAHTLSATVVGILLSATVGSIPFVDVTFLALFGFAANSIPLTPGGLGIGEAAFDSLFRIAGVEGGATAMLAWRVLLVALAPMGLFLYVAGQRFHLAPRS